MKFGEWIDYGPDKNLIRVGRIVFRLPYLLMAVIDKWHGRGSRLVSFSHRWFLSAVRRTREGVDVLCVMSAYRCSRSSVPAECPCMPAIPPSRDGLLVRPPPALTRRQSLRTPRLQQLLLRKGMFNRLHLSPLSLFS